MEYARGVDRDGRGLHRMSAEPAPAQGEALHPVAATLRRAAAASLTRYASHSAPPARHIA